MCFLDRESLINIVESWKNRKAVYIRFTSKQAIFKIVDTTTSVLWTLYSLLMNE